MRRDGGGAGRPPHHHQGGVAERGGGQGQAEGRVNRVQRPPPGAPAVRVAESGRRGGAGGPSLPAAWGRRWGGRGGGGAGGGRTGGAAGVSGCRLLLFEGGGLGDGGPTQEAEFWRADHPLQQLLWALRRERKVKKKRLSTKREERLMGWLEGLAAANKPNSSNSKRLIMISRWGFRWDAVSWVEHAGPGS